MGFNLRWLDYYTSNPDWSPSRMVHSPRESIVYRPHVECLIRPLPLPVLSPRPLLHTRRENLLHQIRSPTATGRGKLPTAVSPNWIRDAAKRHQPFIVALLIS